MPAAVAAERGIEVVESRSTRTRNYTSLISVKLQTSDGERWVEGAVFERKLAAAGAAGRHPVEAPLEGTMIVICNTDQPGVIGQIGTILGRHDVNIANFALGRDGDRAVGVVIVDETAPIPDAVLDELRKVPGDSRSANRQGVSECSRRDGPVSRRQFDPGLVDRE